MISYAVFCLKKNTIRINTLQTNHQKVKFEYEYVRKNGRPPGIGTYEKILWQGAFRSSAPISTRVVGTGLVSPPLPKPLPSFRGPRLAADPHKIAVALPGGAEPTDPQTHRAGGGPLRSSFLFANDLKIV